MIILGGVISALIACAMTPIVNRLAMLVGAVDFSRLSTQTTAPIPRSGGVLIFFSCLISFALLIPWVSASWLSSPPLVSQSVAFLIGTVLILLVGIIDDIYGLRARWKLLAQIVVAVVVWGAGLRVEVVTNLLDPSNPIHLGLWSLPVFVFWVVLCVNAMNIIDGIDGLASGIFLIGILFFLINCFVTGMFLLALVSAIWLGATLYFLAMNLRKKMYLGDGGSLLLGFTLSCIVPFSTPKSAGLASVLIPLGVLSVPIAEVIVTTLRRVLQGKPIGKADKGHIHYRLLKSGLKIRQVTLLISTTCFLCGLLALSMTMVFIPKIALILGFGWIVILILFFGFGYRTLSKGHNGNNELRNTLFLDTERILLRRLKNFEECCDMDCAREMINEYTHLLKATQIRVSFSDKQGDILFAHDLGTEDGKQELDYSAELVIKRKTENGCLGQMIASINLESEEPGFRETGYWLDLLMLNLSKWIDRFDKVSDKCKSKKIC